MIRNLMAPKWQEFHKSLASMLGMTLGLVDDTGNIKALFNPQPPFTALDDDGSPLAVDYKKFFINFSPDSGHIQVDRDPLGLILACIPLDQSLSLFLCGGLERGDQEAEQRFLAKLEKYGHNSMQDRPLDVCSLDEVRDKASSVQTLYNRLGVSLNEISELGKDVILLAALDEINKLIVGLLSPENFDLRRILDLVASSLVILLDARGAWVFTHCLTRCETVLRGQNSVFLEDAEKTWRTTAVAQNDPIVALTAKFNGVESIAAVDLRMSDSSLSLGVLEPEGDNIHAVLSAFSKQVAIAMEMDSLYNILQRRIGVLLNSIRHGVVVTNSEGLVMVINQAAAKILGSHGINLVLCHPLAGQGMCPVMEKAASGASKGHTYFKRQSLIHRDDYGLHLNWDAAPLIQKGGAIAGSILLFEDITESVFLNMQVREWQRLATAGEVAAGLAHEIRNPLAAARGALQLLDMASDEARRRQLMDKFTGELDRMNSILTDFLNISKPVLEEEVAPVNLAEVVQEISFLIKSEALLVNVELIISPSSYGTPWAISNSSSLKQVFLNITKNALEAMANGGVLLVSLGRDDTCAWVEFKDNGQGISLEHQDNIFRPFFTTKISGTGLGLAISNRIINHMGGEIIVDSAPGSGTAVKVLLPVWQEKSNQEAE